MARKAMKESEKAHTPYGEEMLADSVVMSEFHDLVELVRDRLNVVDRLGNTKPGALAAIWQTAQHLMYVEIERVAEDSERELEKLREKLVARR